MWYGQRYRITYTTHTNPSHHIFLLQIKQWINCFWVEDGDTNNMHTQTHTHTNAHTHSTYIYSFVIAYAHNNNLQIEFVDVIKKNRATVGKFNIMPRTNTTQGACRMFFSRCAFVCSTWMFLTYYVCYFITVCRMATTNQNTSMQSKKTTQTSGNYYYNKWKANCAVQGSLD